MIVIKIVILVFAILGAIDYIAGCRFQLGKEFVSGLMLMGTMLLSVQGMIVIAPAIALLIEPVCNVVKTVLHMEPSIIPAMLLANDMGGAPLATAISPNAMGSFNGLVVASMMGCTVSYTIPFALGLVPKERHKNLLLGLLCGIVTIPIGCLVGGIICGVSILALLWDLLPLILLAGVIAFGLLKFPNVCLKIFGVLGWIVKALVVVGLVFGMIYFMTGKALLPGIVYDEAKVASTGFATSWDEGLFVCTNAAIFLAGAFPLVHLVSRLLRRPLRVLGRVLRINEASALCLLSSLASSSPTFGMMKVMDDRGAIINSAFAVSGAFILASHLAFTISIDPSYVPAMIAGKLTAGVLAVIVAIFISKRMVPQDKSDTAKDSLN